MTEPTAYDVSAEMSTMRSRYPLVIGAEVVVLAALAYAIAVLNISHPDLQQITIDTLSGMVEHLEREHAN